MYVCMYLLLVFSWNTNLPTLLICVRELLHVEHDAYVVLVTYMTYVYNACMSTRIC